ncbi:aminotransferase class V-fold PLP-dependent enzyme [Candidatus Saccharibacteria bacterium]|nr:aminotransferase class V-fold PLP-dependent enzyme [Candidatus Saccharibacteria bacterium]
MRDFNIPENKFYFDSACQTLRPKKVQDAMMEYYNDYGTCGERVKYEWGKKVDEKVDEARKRLLKYLGASPKKYFVSWTLNTTYGLNLVLAQLNLQKLKIHRVITSEIEHNSVFLTSMKMAQNWQIEREVLKREDDGSVKIDDYSEALIILNVSSNIDGRKLKNVKDIVKKAHKKKSIVILDCAQGLIAAKDILHKCGADVMCFSAHKAYGPSLGAIVCKRDLIENLTINFIGGGMVNDVWKNNYKLSADKPKSDHAHTTFEAGLLPYAEVIGFGAALDYIEKAQKSDKVKEMDKLGNDLFKALKKMPKVKLVNEKASSVITFYVKGFDSHLLAGAFDDEGIMVRSGYFCCHYYLSHVKKYPPLIRVSLGLHNTQKDVKKFIEILEKVGK